MENKPALGAFFAVLAFVSLLVAVTFALTKDRIASVLSAAYSEQIAQLNDPNVQNGSITEKYTLNRFGCTTVVVPTKATVDTAPPGDDITLTVEKHLGFAGHPGRLMTAETEGKNMFCLWKVDGKRLLIGLSGEWDSHIEGGAYINLTCHVPATLQVQKSDEFKSLVNDTSWVSPDGSLKIDRWSNPIGEGWTKLTP